MGLIDQVVRWGRQAPKHRGTAYDFNGRMPAEQLRQALIERHKAGDPAVTGSGWQGYILLLESGERVGLTNGYGRGFTVFYEEPRRERVLKPLTIEQIEGRA